MLLESTIIAIVMSILVIFIRLKASQKPVNAKKIILPPFFMSTGVIMYVFPYFRITPTEMLEAVLLGLFFSIFLIKTSNFQVVDREIYLKRSKAFGFILIGLLLVRIVLKLILSSSIDVGELSGMFWLIAFCMIVPWRVTMYVQYRRIEARLNRGTLTTETI
ncbi:cytochrome c biogenesis protein CcdC [Bacillus carboniphilus]|uniref:Cytochrome c biogenesis protein CcdC n=1 Tax=Bacillus carboniphilus TaxID=86663 RepID=A0ABP3G6J8_9BACI